MAGVYLLFLIPSFLSWVTDFRLFGDYDRTVSSVLMLIGLILFLRVFPSVKRKE